MKALITNHKTTTMQLELISEDKHEELSSLLKPLVKFMDENKFSYFIVAGKDMVCARYMNGQFDDVSGMITGMMEKNKQVAGMIEYSLENLKS